MKKISLLIPISMILCFVSCAPVHVKYDYDSEIDFSDYQTYDFMRIPKDMKGKTLLLKRIQRAVEQDLKAKGYRRTSVRPDLLIAVHATGRDKINISSWGYRYAPYRYWRGPGYWGGRGIAVHRYKQGTVVVDMVAADRRELVWRSAASKALPANMNPDKIDRYVSVAVERALKNFPPN